MSRDQRIRLLEQRLSDYTARIAALDEQSQHAELLARTEMQADIRELQDLRRKAEEQLATLRVADAEAWHDENLRTGILAIFDSIGRRLDRVVSRR